ncbi:MAG TPA: nickel pincer cofactor biosynthesis protein LarB [Alphaproteobacteria bacterium]|nr:nickel pincer cofactor biosynthesis protein LarB [Alphaproteobacteria bacterium]
MPDTFKDLGYAKTDMTRAQRTGSPEAIFGAGKTNEQLVGIFNAFLSDNRAVFATRCSAEQAAFVKAAGLPVSYDETSRILSLVKGEKPHLGGRIAVCTAGTADLPVAEEAAQTAEFLGATVDRFFDVGVAGIHRLFAKIDEIRQADAVIAVAGMEGALAGVVAGLVAVPVIAVPTSVGYGASFHGLSALLTMLNSCAEGVSVVNIDNGFGAAVTACRIVKGKHHD